MSKFKRVSIQGSEIAIMGKKTGDFISLTDMAKSQMQEAIIIKWLSLKNTIEYLGEWEALYNPDFNYTEFGIISMDESPLSSPETTPNSPSPQHHQPSAIYSS